MAQKAKMGGAISFDTSSKDPVLVRSRIFVGGINTNIVTREDVIHLFESYGTILGVTCFNKYAFIQYSSASEADLAISALNMYYWHGSALDVKLAVSEEKIKAMNGSSGKRSADESISSDVKRKRQDSEGEEIFEINGKKEIADTFICGACHFVTSSLETFIQHRKNACEPRTGKKSIDEPEKFECTNCSSEFDLTWELLDHLSKAHSLTVFRDSTKQLV